MDYADSLTENLIQDVTGHTSQLVFETFEEARDCWAERISHCSDSRHYKIVELPFGYFVTTRKFARLFRALGFDIAL